MPPQQTDGLLDFLDDRLDFGAHFSPQYRSTLVPVREII